MQNYPQWLASVGLQAYIGMFQQQNFTDESFLALPIQKYSDIGVVNVSDKQKLFKLITQIKQQIPQQQQAYQQVVGIPLQGQPQQYQQQSQQYMQPQQVQQPQYAQNPPQQDSNPSGELQGRPNQFTQNPTAHPNCPNVIDNRGIPTINRTVIPPDKTFLDIIQQKIRVVVRKRPVNNHEMQLGNKDILSCDGWNQISVHEPKVKVDLTKYIEVTTYKFDQVFSENADNYEVYFYTAKPLINAIFQGKNATCFAFGQTGSGKTWTMMQKTTGIYVLAANDIFHMLHKDPTYSQLSLQAYVSFYEIYGGKFFDLLNNRHLLRPLEDKNNVVQIYGIYEKQINTVQDLLGIIEQGLNCRQVGATGANADSSRSHAVLQIVLKAPNGKAHGKISFIDLAGAERASDVQNTDRQTRMEGADINKSLLALKECIRAMDKNGAHPPFRDSKLTLVLRDSFIKDSRTVMIACCSPTDKSCENSQNTLRYADRVKNLINSAGVVKVDVIKPSQNVADIILGNVNNDAEIAQQKYLQQVALMQGAAAGNQGLQNQFAAYGAKQVGPPPQVLAGAGQAPRQSYAAVQGVVGAPGVPPYGFPPPGAPQQLQQPAQAIPEVFIEPVRPDNDTPTDQLVRSHGDIVDNIYALEEEITLAHRQQVDQMMTSVKEEVNLIHDIQNGAISIDAWIQQLESILTTKETAIRQLRGQINVFKQKLAEEQKLSESAKVKK